MSLCPYSSLDLATSSPADDLSALCDVVELVWFLSSVPQLFYLTGDALASWVRALSAVLLQFSGVLN